MSRWHLLIHEFLDDLDARIAHDESVGSTWFDEGIVEAEEDCLHLDRLPTPAEAVLIREALGIRKRRNLTEDGRAQLEAARSLLIRPQTA